MGAGSSFVDPRWPVKALMRHTGQVTRVCNHRRSAEGVKRCPQALILDTWVPGSKRSWVIGHVSFGGSSTAENWTVSTHSSYGLGCAAGLGASSWATGIMLDIMSIAVGTACRSVGTGAVFGASMALMVSSWWRSRSMSRDSISIAGFTDAASALRPVRSLTTPMICAITGRVLAVTEA